MDKICDKRNKLVEEKHKLQKRLNEIELILKDLETTIINNCKHEWINYREEGMYGERYTVCKICGVNRGY